MREPDRDLEQLFREARDAETRFAPPFAAILGRRGVASRPVRLRTAVLVAVAVAFAGLLWQWRPTPEAAPDDASLGITFTPGEMRVLTDYLLEMAPVTPAGEIPRIGAPEWFIRPDPDADPNTRRSP